MTDRQHGANGLFHEVWRWQTRYGVVDANGLWSELEAEERVVCCLQYGVRVGMVRRGRIFG